MKLGSKIAAFAGAMILAGASFAAGKTVDRCPSVSAIQSEGIPMVYEMGMNIYLGYHMSNYDSENLWIFAIGPVQGADEEDALMIANEEMLPQVSGNPTPESEDDLTYCLYNMPSEEHMAIAILADDMTSPAKLRKFFRK